LLAFLFFSASVVTGVGLYLSAGEQKTSDAVSSNTVARIESAEQKYGDMSNRWASADSQIRSQSNELMSTRRDVADQQYKLDHSEQLVLPRMLSYEQQLALLKTIEILPRANILITAPQNVLDAEELAKKIWQVFKTDRWAVELETPGMLMPTPRDIVVIGKDAQRGSIEAVAGKLKAFGLKVTPHVIDSEPTDSTASNSFSIIIGYR
jgi:hypothetical protein